MENSAEISVLYFNTRDEMLRVDLRKVVYFKADRNYTDVYFLNGHHFTLPANMMSLENMLNDKRMNGKNISFVRLGRGVIVNIFFIVHINILRQELILGDMQGPVMHRISISKDALRKLKEIYYNSVK